MYPRCPKCMLSEPYIKAYGHKAGCDGGDEWMRERPKVKTTVYRDTERVIQAKIMGRISKMGLKELIVVAESLDLPIVRETYTVEI